LRTQNTSNGFRLYVGVFLWVSVLCLVFLNKVDNSLILRHNFLDYDHRVFQYGI